MFVELASYLTKHKYMYVCSVCWTRMIDHNIIMESLIFTVALYNNIYNNKGLIFKRIC